MSILQLLGICAGVMILMFFIAETQAIPFWARYLCYYIMLGTAIAGLGSFGRTHRSPSRIRRSKLCSLSAVRAHGVEPFANTARKHAKNQRHNKPVAKKNKICTFPFRLARLARGCRAA